jgi:hypothetical protein
MFAILLIVRINKSEGIQGIIHYPHLRGMFPYQLATGIPLRKGVL